MKGTVMAGLRSGAWGRGSLRASVLAPALVAMMVYGIWTVGFFATGHDARDLTFMGLRLLRQSHASAVIQIDPTYHYYPNGIGYDGQYFYYMALDPLNAHFYMDWPEYRYTRVLYPLLARLLALGQPALVAYALLLVNWLAIAGGTLAVAAWLKRRGVSPWLALIYAFYPGLFIGFQHDLSEPLAYALVAVGVYLYDTVDSHGRRRLALAGVAFAFAALARETTLAFALLYALATLLTGVRASVDRLARLRANVAPTLTLAGCALAPLAVYRGILWLWLGPSGVPPEVTPARVPFGGLIAWWPWSSQQIMATLVVVLPALICAAAALWALRRGSADVALWVALTQVVFFVVLLPVNTYYDIYSTDRVATGVMLAALYCIPALDRVNGRNRTWLLASAGLWLALVPWLFLTDFFFWTRAG